MTLAFIAGSDLKSVAPFRDAVPIESGAVLGEDRLFALRHGRTDDVADPRKTDLAYLLLRHGADQSTPPHRIPHRQNIELLRSLGVSGIISFCSVGSLNRDWGPGTLCIASDFINLAPVLTRFDKTAEHVTPVVSEGLRSRIRNGLHSMGSEFEEEGVYWQSIGPRLETRAEIRMISSFADIVGMTFGHEATLANEAGIPIAALCRVDNFGHGLVESEAEQAGLVDQIRIAKRASVGFFAALANQLIHEEPAS